MVVGCVTFSMKRIKKPKKTLEITVYKAWMTWWFKEISGRHTYRRIYGRNISSTWHLSNSHDVHSPVPTTKTGKFMVRWPRTPTTPFCSLHMRSGWSTNSPTLWERIYRQPVVSQPLEAPNQYRAPSLRRSWPWDNTQLISPSSISNTRWIMNNSARWSWTWNQRWVLRVCPLFGCMVLGTTNLLLFLLLQLYHYSISIFLYNEYLDFILFNLIFTFFNFKQFYFLN